ncbi:hypothetical protein [Xanthomonas axonopodis]|nr:hypothetical protein [Xanthomonas citri]
MTTRTRRLRTHYRAGSAPLASDAGAVRIDAALRSSARRSMNWCSMQHQMRVWPSAQRITRRHGTAQRVASHQTPRVACWNHIIIDAGIEQTPAPAAQA